MRKVMLMLMLMLMLMANLSQRASHSSMLWLVKMIDVPDLRVQEDKNNIEIRESVNWESTS